MFWNFCNEEKLFVDSRMIETEYGQSRILQHDAAWDDDIVFSFQRGYGCDNLLTAPQLPAMLKRGVTVAICTYKRAASLSRFLDSLAAQASKPEQLIIVDASPDDETQHSLQNRANLQQLAKCFLYFRVQGSLKGLTRQRNFALRWVATDLVAFFDDDIVLLPGCLQQLERPHRLSGDVVAGVSAAIENQHRPPGWLWRTRRILYVVPDLRPGKYYRSGVRTPWSFLRPTERLVEGDWLAGGTTMWKTSFARELGFNELFEGYAQAEDLEFSLRARRCGKLVLAGAARLLHLPDPSGRPSHYWKGYMNFQNRYRIHRRSLPHRTHSDVLWFIYASVIDRLLFLRHVILPGRWLFVTNYLRGELLALCDIVRGTRRL